MNRFVAGFIGTVNQLPARALQSDRWQVLNRTVVGNEAGTAGVEGTVAVRPEHIALDRSDIGPWTIESTSFLGPMTRLVVAQPGHQSLLVDLASSDAVAFPVGSRVQVRLRDDVGQVTVLTLAPLASRMSS